MGAQQCMSIPEPLEDWAGVSMDGTVQDGRASLDDSLRHVSFPLQHWRLCRDNHHFNDQNTRKNAPEQACSTGLPLTRMNESAWMEPTLFSAMHTYVPAWLLVTFSMIRELLPASSTVAPGSSETLQCWDWLAVTTEVTSGLLPVWGLLLTVQEMTGDGVPWAWQDKASLWPLFKVTSPGSSLKAGLMLMDRRLSCLADPAALVATQVNTPASAGCVKEPEPIQRLPVRFRADKQSGWADEPQPSRWSTLLIAGLCICLEGWALGFHSSPRIFWVLESPEQHRTAEPESPEWQTAPSVLEKSGVGLKGTTTSV